MLSAGRCSTWMDKMGFYDGTVIPGIEIPSCIQLARNFLNKPLMVQDYFTQLVGNLDPKKAGVVVLWARLFILIVFLRFDNYSEVTGKTHECLIHLPSCTLILLFISLYILCHLFFTTILGTEVQG